MPTDRLRKKTYSPKLPALSSLPTWFLAAVGGITYALGNIGWGFWPLALFCLLPFWSALRQKQARRYRHAFLIGLQFGLAVYLFGFSWLWSLGDQFVSEISSTALLFTLYGAWFSAGFGLYALCFQFLTHKHFPFWASAGLPWILLESFQYSLFPVHLGSGLIHQIELAQLASVGGPLLLSALVLMINLVLFALLSRIPRSSGVSGPRLWSPLGVSLVCLSGAYLFGQHQVQFLEEEPVSRFQVGVIQNNIVSVNQAQLSNMALARNSHEANLALSRELVDQHDIDLLVWPESAYSRALRRPLPFDAQMIRKDLKVPLLFGGTSNWHYRGQANSANSVFLSDASGRIEQAYDKQQLLPFAEKVPGLNWIEQLSSDLPQTWLVPFKERYLKKISKSFPWHQSFRAGPERNTLSLNQLNIATPICYEVIDPDYVRSLVTMHAANLIVTIANDAWFGKTQEPAIHLALAQLRAIEHGLWLVRATNSGHSAIIQPNGKVVSQTGLFTQETLTGAVSPRPATTFYSLYGNWVTLLSLFLLLSLSVGKLAPALMHQLSLRPNR